jgi:hypothetical protein
VDPPTTTMSVGATAFVTITVTPGSALVNGVQIHGRVDPNHLRLIDAQPLAGALPLVLDPVTFDPVTGVFRYGAGLLNGVITEPFALLVLEVEAVATTTITGAEVAFLFDFPPTDISGPAGSVLDEAQNGLVIIDPGATLHATVNLQGRPADKSDPSWAIPLTVTLTKVASGVSQTFTPTTDQGNFTLTLIEPGLYDIQVKGSHTLRNLAEHVDLVTGNNSYFLDTLLEGDVEVATTFNQVVLPDFGMLSGSFNKCPTDPGFVVNADLNESHCVTLVDFGLLAGNFNRQGDVVITAMPTAPAGLRQASNHQARLAFNVEEMAVVVDRVVTVTVEIDPRGSAVNGGMVHLRFDPARVEVLGVHLTGQLPVVLQSPIVNNQQGVVQFAAGMLGQTRTDKFPMATLALKVKGDSSPTTITPVVNLFPPTDVSGPEESVLGEVRGLTLKPTVGEPDTSSIFLPIVIK